MSFGGSGEQEPRIPSVTLEDDVQQLLPFTQVTPEDGWPKYGRRYCKPIEGDKCETFAAVPVLGQHGHGATAMVRPAAGISYIIASPCTFRQGTSEVVPLRCLPAFNYPKHDPEALPDIQLESSKTQDILIVEDPGTANGNSREMYTVASLGSNPSGISSGSLPSRTRSNVMSNSVALDTSPGELAVSHQQLGKIYLDNGLASKVDTALTEPAGDTPLSNDYPCSLVKFAGRFTVACPASGLRPQPGIKSAII